MNEKVMGVVRAIVAAGVGYLAGKGLIDAGSADAIVAAVSTLVVAAWSVWSK